MTKDSSQMIWNNNFAFIEGGYVVEEAVRFNCQLCVKRVDTTEIVNKYLHSSQVTDILNVTCACVGYMYMQLCMCFL